MIKIENIKSHSLHPSKDKVSVAPARLMLVDPDGCQLNSLTSHGRLVTDMTRNSVQTGKNHLDIDLWWKKSETKFFGIPILISDTEKIIKDDWVWDRLNKVFVQASMDYKQSEDQQYFKILALPEHFSPEQLKMIVDGKLKDFDNVLVECEEVNKKQVCVGMEGKPAKPINRWIGDKVIKLDPLTIFPIEEIDAKEVIARFAMRCGISYQEAVNRLETYNEILTKK